MKEDRVREAVGVFGDYAHMESAVNALETFGFSREHISVLGSQEAVRKRFGAQHVDVQILEDHPNAPRGLNIRQEELSLGQGGLVGGGILMGVLIALVLFEGLVVSWIALAVAAVGALMGGLLGVFLARFLGKRYVAAFQEQLAQGGLLVWVNTPTPQMEKKAQEILKQYGARDVHLHSLPAVGTAEVDTIEPYHFGDMFVALERIFLTHQKVLYEDHMMTNKLQALLDLLKKAATAQLPASLKTAEMLLTEIEATGLYAKDMAEEAQRILAESQESAQGNEEEISEQYFSLSWQLRKLRASSKKKFAQLKERF